MSQRFLVAKFNQGRTEEGIIQYPSEGGKGPTMEGRWAEGRAHLLSPDSLDITYSSIHLFSAYAFMDPLHMPVSLLGTEDSGKPGPSVLSQSSWPSRTERETEARRGHHLPGCTNIY